MSTTEADVRVFLLDHLHRRLRDAGLDAGDLSDETDLFGEGVIDSLGVIETIAIVSDHFGIEDEWDDYDHDDLLVVGRFCRYVAARARQVSAAEA